MNIYIYMCIILCHSRLWWHKCSLSCDKWRNISKQVLPPNTAAVISMYIYIVSSINKTVYVCLSVTILLSYTIQQFAFDCHQTLQQGASWQMPTRSLIFIKSYFEFVNLYQLFSTCLFWTFCLFKHKETTLYKFYFIKNVMLLGYA